MQEIIAPGTGEVARRYTRNRQSLSVAEQELLARSSVAVVGCGGLGGYILEELARIGVGRITAWDGDVFEETNLNRQLLATMEVLDQPKAQVAVQRIRSVNPLVEASAVTRRFTGSPEDKEILGRHQLVVDALDNIGSRRQLAECSRQLGIPLIHGAIAGWSGQVCTLFPGDDTLELIYGSAVGDKGIEKALGNLPFTAATVASLQAAEAVKVLLGREGILRHRLLIIDLLSMDMEVLSIRE